ncbi:MAG: ABC transporter ATP-binding protein [Lachnospiraceae bacterium]|nr:ABC transporter ATP-binding protein [Lachnospiraceae bacterium]
MKKSTASRTLYYYGRAVMKHWPFFILGILVSFGYTFCLTFMNARVVADIVDVVGRGGVTADNVFPTFMPYIIKLIIVNLIGQICSKLQDYCVWKVEILVYYDLSTLIFDSLSNQSMTFHNSRFGGALVSQTSKFTGAFERLTELLMYSLVPLISSTVLTIVLLAPLVPLYVIILCVILVIYVVVVFLLFKRALRLNSQAASAQNRLSGELSDSITNILAVKTSGREAYEKDLFTKANIEVRKADSKRMHSTIFNASVAAGMIVIIMSIQTIFVAGGNAWYGISAGTLVLIFSYTHSLTSRFNMISQTMTVINRSLGDAAEMTQNLDEPRLVDDAPDATELKVTDGAIEFENLSFKYNDGVGEDGIIDEDNPAGALGNIFENFSMSIKPGERIGLVGRSGSGKTTLTRLLLRLADIQEGHIYIDGQDISKVTQVSLRRQIAYVPQEPLLFHRTIAENIAYGRPDASFEEIKEAAIKANALEFIEKLPDGFDTITGERGVKLSGGQRQRVAIARAILTNAPLLVLDEATSALDSESERLIQDALNNLMENRTSIVIAHRLSTVSNLDRIVVLKDGQIIEDGTHAELIRNGGEYAGLWERQTGAFNE